MIFDVPQRQEPDPTDPEVQRRHRGRQHRGYIRRCTDCGEEFTDARPYKAKGLCNTCYGRHIRAVRRRRRGLAN